MNRKDGGQDFRNVPGSKPHVPKNKGKSRKTEKQNWKRFEEI